jgi:hypothetical protein
MLASQQSPCPIIASQATSPSRGSAASTYRAVSARGSPSHEPPTTMQVSKRLSDEHTRASAIVVVQKSSEPPWLGLRSGSHALNRQ